MGTLGEAVQGRGMMVALVGSPAAQQRLVRHRFSVGQRQGTVHGRGLVRERRACPLRQGG